MQYAIKKRRPDERINTCGFLLEDGMVRVADCTLYNAPRFIKILWHGYIVYETHAPEGYYSEEEWDLFGGQPVDPVKLGLINPKMDKRLESRRLDELPEL